MSETQEQAMQEIPAKPAVKVAKSDFSLIKGALLGAIAGFAASYFVLGTQISRMEERLDLSPPIVVVDFVEIASSYPQGATAEELEPLMKKTNNSIKKLKDAGYIVIDYQNILAAPSDIVYPFSTVSTDE